MASQGDDALRIEAGSGSKAPEGDAVHDVVERAERSRVSAPEASWALRDVNRAAAEVDHALGRRLELRPIEYAAITHVLTASSPIGPLELSNRLAISSGSATELVDRLERSGHLERRREHRDRRRVTLHLTDRTAGRILQELGALFADIDQLASNFSEPELQTITRYLRAAAGLMRRYASSSGADL